ncbi:HAMP domain-containing histidine kinase [Sphingomonas sinipercae]|uniref:histidine kinase n=1 Tax=Sphingomonas sinipercae TaxID=2714944 RepID=A0A6G7ZN81_9SPHN|nr:HAMP domain-containing histidine kinase [Sphingomonas sinipercae]QIL02393.1 HAMP domain-containing histidine kinase [Sphingomonas sinipercae]
MLAQPADHPRDRAVRWRQLVELLARSGSADDDLSSEAIAQIKAGFEDVDERVRMAAARTIAPLDAPVELICAFAADRLSVAAPVLASARLSATEWAEVNLCASPECRRFIASLRTEPAPQAGNEAPQRAAPQFSSGEMPTISEVLSRIERLRQSREQPSERPQPVEQPTEPPKLFRWECDESGEIDWVDGPARTAVIGRTIAERSEGIAEPAIERAFALRVPFRDAAIELAPGSELGGWWTVSGTPAFEPASGRFAGYRGVAERQEAAAEAAPAQQALPRDPDSLRELVHEIKTPLNAIIGFAEMIQGQYLGPASDVYRGRSQDIVTQARMLLGAVEDLDMAAKLCSPRAGECPEVHLGAAVEQLIAAIRDEAALRGAELEASRATGEINVRIDPQLLERLILRMCAAVIGCAEVGERLRLAVDRDNGNCIVSISRPEAIRDAGEDQLFGASGEGMASGYWLRLARMLARMSGGDVVADADRIALQFPRA